jgi:TolA-binding protein
MPRFRRGLRRFRASTADPTPSQTASLGSENDQYKAAYGHVLSGDYANAEQEFTQYLAQYPGSARAADANFWLGEALYSQGKYNEAAKTFLECASEIQHVGKSA